MNRVHIREVLKDDPSRSERNLHSLSLGLLPVEDAFHIGALHQKLIAVPDRRLQEDPDGERQTVWGADGQWTSQEYKTIHTPWQEDSYLHPGKSCCYHIWDLQVWRDYKTAASGSPSPEVQLYVGKDSSQSQPSSSVCRYKSKAEI